MIFPATGNRTDDTVIGTNNRRLDDGTYTYQYDDAGNRIRRTDKVTEEYRSYTWDHHNNNTAVTFHDSTGAVTQIIEYRYDAFNRLIARFHNTDGSGAVEDKSYFLYDSAPGKGGLDDVVLVYDENGNVVHRYLHGPAVDQLFADESAVDGLLWALADRQGSIRDWADHDLATNSTSAYNHIVFDSFGNITSQSNPAHQVTIGFTGRYIDPVTGLQYNRRRWYDPTVGRWLSEDPIGFGGGQVNLSVYVGNSPTNGVDPSGLGGMFFLIPPIGPIWNGTAANNAADMATVYHNSIDAGYSPGGAAYNAIGVGVANPTGVRGCSDAFSRHDAVDGHRQSTGERVVDGFIGSISLGATGLGAVGAAGAIRGAAARGRLISRVRCVPRSPRPSVLDNKAKGDAFRDEIADLMRKEGRTVDTEVTKTTPLGRRVIDIEVSNKGRVLGGIETKAGKSPYKPSQRAKDQYLRETGYPVHVVRGP